MLIIMLLAIGARLLNLIGLKRLESGLSVREAEGVAGNSLLYSFKHIFRFPPPSRIRIPS